VYTLIAPSSQSTIGTSLCYSVSVADTLLKFNITKGKNLLDMLEASIKKYQNNLLTTAEIIEELAPIIKDVLKQEFNLNIKDEAFISCHVRPPK